MLPDILKGLAALSIVADQYQLCHGGAEPDWVEWIEALESCWTRWNERRAQHHGPTDEKKQEEDPCHRCGGPTWHPGPPESLTYPHHAFPAAPPPGPVDGRPLSDPRRPLLLHPRVSLSMRTLAAPGKDDAAAENYPAMVACPVPSSFYELLRATVRHHLCHWMTA